MTVCFWSVFPAKEMLILPENEPSWNLHPYTGNVGKLPQGTFRYTSWNDGLNIINSKCLFKPCVNKHTVSIAEAIHVPFRPQQISKRHNPRKNTWKDTIVNFFLYYVNTNSHPKFDVNILQDTRKKCGKLNITKENIWCAIRSIAIKVKLDLYYVKTNSHMEFQIYMSKDDKEKSGKWNVSKG